MAKKKENKIEETKVDSNPEVDDDKEASASSVKKGKKKELSLKTITDSKAGKKTKSLVNDFKAFISRGNVVDMAVGVVIGGAFSAVVTALTNVFLSACTWAVPGGLKGLITVLPPSNKSQQGMMGIGQYFLSSDLDNMAAKLAQIKKPGSILTPNLIEEMSKKLTDNYVLHGDVYVYKTAAIIDWGAFINAVLAFFIIALVLFAVVKGFAAMKKAREVAKEKALEEYYTKHPELRPQQTATNIPELTEKDLLKEILRALKEQRLNDAAKVVEKDEKNKTNKK